MNPAVSIGFISHTVFIQLFCESQFPHVSVNLFFMLSTIKDKSTDLCGNRLLRDDFRNTFCEIRVDGGGRKGRKRGIERISHLPLETRNVRIQTLDC